MSNIKAIRAWIGVTQSEMADGIGCTQGNISAYELGRHAIPADVAKKLIAYAKTLGKKLTYDAIYKQPTQANEVTHARLSTTGRH